jgi:hypothetical protein
MGLFTLFTRKRKPKRKSMRKPKSRRNQDKNKYNKLSKVQCNDTGTDCIWDDKVTVFD